MGQIAVLSGNPSPYDLDFFGRVFNDNNHSMRRFLSIDEFLSSGSVSEHDIVLTHRQPVGTDLFSRCPDLRGVVSLAIGLEYINVDAASELGIAVVSPRTEQNIAALAEGVVSMTLTSTTDIFRKQQLLREKQPRGPGLGRLLFGKTVGFVGFGQIGQAVAERLKPFGVDILANTRTVRKLPEGIESAQLDELLKTSDVVIVVASLNEQSHGMLSAERLAQMKPNVVFVNIARGKIVDEGALYRIASERPDMRLALDVYQTEPLPAESPLRSLSNATLTPHCMGYSSEMWQFRVRAICHRALTVLRGQWPEGVANPEVEAEWRRRWENAVA